MRHSHIKDKTIWIILFLSLPLSVMAQMGNTISREKDKPNTLSVSASYGENFTKNAWFYGFSGDYGRRLKNLPVGVGASFMWDEETPRNSNNRSERTFTLAVTGSYLLTDRFSTGGGLAKNIIKDDNPERKYEWVNGPWIAGLFFNGIAFDFGNSYLSSMITFEYNITDDEFSISIDISYGLLF